MQDIIEKKQSKWLIIFITIFLVLVVLAFVWFKYSQKPKWNFVKVNKYEAIDKNLIDTWFKNVWVKDWLWSQWTWERK